MYPFTEQQVEESVTTAIGKSKFFPSVAELLGNIHEATIQRHKEHAKQQNQGLLKRADKPDTWNFRIEETYAEIDKRAAELRELDIAFQLGEADHIWPKLSSTNRECRCPKHRIAHGGLFWVCYDRIMTAKTGKPVESARELAARLKKMQ